MKGFLQRNAETIVLATALLIISTLVAWWAIFAHRLIVEHNIISSERAERLSFMIQGESGVFATAMVACMVALFLIARRARQQRSRLERLLQFTSHELKTPIAGVRALLQSLGLGSVPDELRGDLLEQGIRECDRLEHLAETILAYQRTVTRKQHYREKVRADVLLDEVMSHRKATTQGEKLEVQAATAPQVWADRDAFRVILENLLDNARKYGGGQTLVSTALEGKSWRVQVRDQGQGFDPRDAEALFDPFTPRGKNTGVTHGSGLGLSISRQLARQMGGDLTAQSDGPGKGSTFTLSLHAADA